MFYQLGQYGIIVKEESVKVQVLPNTKPSYLKLSFIFIPANIVSLITPYLKVLFQKNVYRTLIPIALLFISIVVGLYFEKIINYSLSGNDLLLFFLLGFISVTFHEFGHVTATEFFGAKQNGIGGGFYIFTPVYFADVSDIWKLPKNQKIVVSLSGVYFELIICSLYVSLGLLLKNEFIILVGSLIFIKTLYNLIPFLRSDGYWILTDLLQIPNLYKDSKTAANSVLIGVFKSPRNLFNNINLKKAFLILYGLVNYIFLGFFLYYIAFYQIKDIIYFPLNIYNYVLSIINEKEDLSIGKLLSFLIPILFYYLVFSLISGLLKKYLRSTSIR